MKTVHLGTLDAEDFWRDAELACLPALHDPAAGRIVAAMDELLFPACQPGDLLITRFPMDDSFANYLEQIGFDFEHNPNPLELARDALDDRAIRETHASIFDILQNAPPHMIQELLSGVIRVAPYAILPGAEDFCRKFSLPYDRPPLEAVVKVNSKEYSHQLAVELGLKNYGCLVGNAAELIEQGKRYLTHGSILIKDPFGVSGKGNLWVQTASMLERIGAHLAAQEKEGKKVSLLVEPLLVKKLDFSCQMRIDPYGQVHYLSLQQMHNQQFSYQGSSRLGAEQTGMLEQCGYLRQMESVAACIYRDGYWGDLCIDSMWLQDEAVVPVVEINARMSMGLLNQYLDRFLSHDQFCSYLGHLSVGYPGPLCIAGLLEKLESAGLLFTQEQRSGILPLSANALTINMNQPDSPRSPSRNRKGRFYFSILAPPEEQSVWLEKLRNCFTELGFLLYN